MSRILTTLTAFNSRLKRAIIPILFISCAAPAFSQEYHVLTADEVEMTNGELVSVKIGKKDFERIEIPSELGGEKVTAIGNGVFERFRLSGVRISEGVKRIGRKAFQFCPLVDISLPDGLKVICDYAFRQSYYDSTIVSLTIPASVDSIGTSAFSDCPIERLILSPGLKYIGDKAFYCSYLTELDVPETVDHIGHDAFFYNYISRLTLPNSIRKLDGFAMNMLTDLQIGPEVVEIADSAFCANLLTSVNIPANVKKVGNYAFARNMEDIQHGFKENRVTVRQITIASGVEWVGDYAFSMSHSDVLYIPKSLKHIGSHAFVGGYGRLVFEDGRTELPRKSFANAVAKSYEFPASIVSIGAGALAGIISGYPVREKFIPLPENIESVGDSAFFGIWCRSISLSSKTKLTVGDCAFYGNWYLERLKIGKGVVSLGRKCFAREETVRGTRIDMSEATDLTHILPGAFEEYTNNLNAELPTNRKWLAYDGTPQNIVSDGYVSVISDPKLGYIAAELTAIKAVTAGDGRAEVYDLTGRRMARNRSHGLTVVKTRQGSQLTVSK